MTEHVSEDLRKALSNTREQLIKQIAHLNGQLAMIDATLTWQAPKEETLPPVSPETPEEPKAAE